MGHLAASARQLDRLFPRERGRSAKSLGRALSKPPNGRLLAAIVPPYSECLYRLTTIVIWGLIQFRGRRWIDAIPLQPCRVVPRHVSPRYASWRFAMPPAQLETCIERHRME